MPPRVRAGARRMRGGLVCLPVCACACACACACVLRCGCVHGMLAARRGEACAFVGWGNGRCVYVCMCVLGGGVGACDCAEPDPSTFLHAPSPTCSAGTSMISLIIPPKSQISQVAKMLADEYGTASNIKSRVNRQVWPDLTRQSRG